MDGSFWVQGTGGSREGFADVWINEKNFEAELVQPRRRITAQDMCDGVGKKKTTFLAVCVYVCVCATVWVCAYVFHACDVSVCVCVCV